MAKEKSKNSKKDLKEYNKINNDLIKEEIKE